MTLIQTLFDEYSNEYNEQMDFEMEDSSEFDQDVYDNALLEMNFYGFVLDVVSQLESKDLTVELEDTSGVSEAVYLAVGNDDLSVKVRIARHESSYDKDVDFVSDFTYNAPAISQLIEAIESKLIELA